MEGLVVEVVDGVGGRRGVSKPEWSAGWWTLGGFFLLHLVVLVGLVIFMGWQGGSFRERGVQGLCPSYFC